MAESRRDQTGDRRQLTSEINALLVPLPWIDFELEELLGYRLVVMGGIDTSAPPDIEIWFEGVAMISMPAEWRTDTSAPPLLLLDGEEARRLNALFGVERGHHLFAFRPEDKPSSLRCVVAARSLGFVRPPK